MSDTTIKHSRPAYSGEYFGGPVEEAYKKNKEEFYKNKGDSPSSKNVQNDNEGYEPGD